MELKRVVVTGLGALTPIGNDVETTWNNAIEGVSGPDLLPILTPQSSRLNSLVRLKASMQPIISTARKPAPSTSMHSMLS